MSYDPTTGLTQVAPRLYYGNLAAAHGARIMDAATVHACKEPCHKQALGYAKSLPNSHPHYLALERGKHLYLNMIDPPLPLFSLPLFAAFFAFADAHLPHRPLIIHCNQGLSRAPSLALLLMAKRLNLLTDENYAAARAAFAAQHAYAPGQGIATFLAANWDLLGR